MEVAQIEPGLWRWTGFHEEWRADVGSVYCETAEGVVVIDPLVPSEDTERFFAALDRDVERAGGAVHVLVTVFWHTRTTAELAERYERALWAPTRGRAAVARRAGQVTDAFRPGDRLPGGIEAFRTARAARSCTGSRGTRARPGDVLLGDGEGGVRMCPESWLPERPTTPSSQPPSALCSTSRSSASSSPTASPSSRTARPSLRRSQPRRLAAAVLWLWILLGALVLLALLAVYGYNRLVRLRNEVDTGWANIDVQLQRRTDLIPNLVETVKAYAAHERGVFEEVTRARAALQQAGSPATAAEANEGLTAALGRPLRGRGGLPGAEGVRELPLSSRTT